MSARLYVFKIEYRTDTYTRDRHDNVIALPNVLKDAHVIAQDSALALALFNYKQGSFCREAVVTNCEPLHVLMSLCQERDCDKHVFVIRWAYGAARGRSNVIAQSEALARAAWSTIAHGLFNPGTIESVTPGPRISYSCDVTFQGFGPPTKKD